MEVIERTQSKVRVTLELEPDEVAFLHTILPNLRSFTVHNARSDFQVKARNVFRSFALAVTQGTSNEEF